MSMETSQTNPAAQSLPPLLIRMFQTVRPRTTTESVVSESAKKQYVNDLMFTFKRHSPLVAAGIMIIDHQEQRKKLGDNIIEQQSSCRDGAGVGGKENKTTLTWDIAVHFPFPTAIQHWFVSTTTTIVP